MTLCHQMSDGSTQGLIWTWAAFALLFILPRLLIRYGVFKRWFVDDVLVISAGCLLLAYAIVWHEYADA